LQHNSQQFLETLHIVELTDKGQMMGSLIVWVRQKLLVMEKRSIPVSVDSKRIKASNDKSEESEETTSDCDKQSKFAITIAERICKSNHHVAGWAAFAESGQQNCCQRTPCDNMAPLCAFTSGSCLNSWSQSSMIGFETVLFNDKEKKACCKMQDQSAMERMMQQ